MTMTVPPLARVLGALLVSVMLTSCSGNDDYPRDWPRIASSWGCPDLRGQWRLGGQPGIDMDLLGDAGPFRAGSGARVRWDAVAIASDAHGNLTIRLVRTAALLASVPYELRRYVEDTRTTPSEPVANDEPTTHREVDLGTARGSCSGSKRSIGPVVGAEADRMFLAVDREGNLVAERTHVHGERIQLNAESPSFSIGSTTDHHWAHWAPMTPAQFEAVRARAFAPGMVFDLGPVRQGTIGVRDVDLVRQEATTQLEAGAKVIAMHPAGAGTVLATIEAADASGIRRALQRMSDERVFELALRRYDPTRDGAIQADVLFARRDAATGATQSQGMQIGEAQAEVLAAVPDTIVFKRLTLTSRGFRLYAYANDLEAVALLLRRLDKSGRLSASPGKAEQVTLSADHNFELDLTPSK